MPFRLFVFVVLLGVPAGARQGAAQDAGSCPAPVAPADTAGRRPDVVLRARVRAAEVRFGSRPEVKVRLTGCAALDSVHVLERRNLPRPIQPGQTYRDVSVAVEIRSYLSVECLLGTPELARLCTPQENPRREDP